MDAPEPDATVTKMVADWVWAHGWFGCAAVLMVVGCFGIVAWDAPWLLLLLVPDYLVLLLVGIEWWRIRKDQLHHVHGLSAELKQIRSEEPWSRVADASASELAEFHALSLLVVGLWLFVGVLFVRNMYGALGEMRLDTRGGYAWMATITLVVGVLSTVLRHMAGEGLFNLTPFRDECKYAENWLTNIVQFVPLHKSPPGKAINVALSFGIILLAVPCLVAVKSVPAAEPVIVMTGVAPTADTGPYTAEWAVPSPLELLCDDDAARAIVNGQPYDVYVQFANLHQKLKCAESAFGSPRVLQLPNGLHAIRFFDRQGAKTGEIVWAQDRSPAVVEEFEVEILNLLNSSRNGSIVAVDSLRIGIGYQLRVLREHDGACWLSFRPQGEPMPTLVAPPLTSGVASAFVARHQVGFPESSNRWRFDGPAGGTVLEVDEAAAQPCPDIDAILELPGPPAPASVPVPTTR